MCAAVPSALSPASSEFDNPLLDFLLRMREQQQLATAVEELQHIDDAAYYHRIIRERECELERLRKRREELKESETAMWAYGEAISITEKQRLQYVVELSHLLVDPQTFVHKQRGMVMRWIAESQRRLGLAKPTSAVTTAASSAATSVAPNSREGSSTPLPLSTTSSVEEEDDQQSTLARTQSSLTHRRPH